MAATTVVTTVVTTAATANVFPLLLPSLLPRRLLLCLLLLSTLLLAALPPPLPATPSHLPFPLARRRLRPIALMRPQFYRRFLLLCPTLLATEPAPAALLSPLAMLVFAKF